MQKKNYLRKTLALVMAFLMIVTMMPVNVMAADPTPSGSGGEPVAVPGGTSTRAVDTPDWEVSDEEANSEYWPLSARNRLVEPSKGDFIKNPTIEYGGSYNYTDQNSKDREVIKLLYKTNSSPGGAWKKMLLKFDKTLYQMIDWDSSQTGVWKNPSTNRGPANPLHFKTGIMTFTLEPKERAGSTNVVSFDIDKAGYKANVLEAPMHFVLKDQDTLKSANLPTSIEELTKDREPIIQMRITDKKYERVRMNPTKHRNGYSTYTPSTVIPRKDYRVGLIPQSQQDNAVPWIYAQDSYISYDKNRGYVDLTIRHNKATLTSLAFDPYIGLRTVMEDKFFNILAGSSYKKPDGTEVAEDSGAKIADVFLLNADEDPYGRGSTYENPITERKISVLRSQINDGKDGLKYIQVVGSDYNKTDYESNIKTQQNGKALDLLINGAVANSLKGVATVVRFYVQPDKFDKIINDSDLLDMTFYTTFTMQTKTPKDTFTGKVDKERVLKQGDELILDVGTSEFGISSAAGDRKITMEVGKRPHTVVFNAEVNAFGGTSLYWKDKTSYWWRIPYDMTLKEGTPIKIYMEGLKKLITEVRFYKNKDEQAKGNNGDFFTIKKDAEKTGDMQYARFAGNLKSPHVAKTQNEASIPEIFTEDNIIYGHTKVGNAIVRATGLGVDNTLLKQAYLTDEEDTFTTAGSGDNEEVIIDQKRSQAVIVNKKMEFGYEFSTKDAINPKDPLGATTGITNKKYKMLKDAPIAFTTEDFSINAVEKLPPIIEQVQAKVKFDLNGGYLGDDPAADKAKDPIVKIAPLNENYRYVVGEDKFPTTTPNPAYKANAFVGPNRRMVYPLKDDGNGKLVQDTSAEKVMASHTDQPLGGETYQAAFNRYNDELKRRLTEAEALPTGLGAPNAIRNAAIKEAQKDIDSFKLYIERFYTSKGIDITKSQLWLREFPGKESQLELKTADPKNEEQGKVFLGWSTRPLTKEESDEFGSLTELTYVKQWEDVDKAPIDKATAYRFTENSPIDKERTVYAVWGQAAIILHSNTIVNGELKDTTVIIPFTNDDKEYTVNQIDAITSGTITNPVKEDLKKKSTIKRIPLVPYKRDSQASSYDSRFLDFAQNRSTFVGWTTTQYKNDATSGFKAGLNNPRLADLDAGKVADTGSEKKSFLKKTEMLTYLVDNPVVSYLPNGMDLYIHESLDDIMKSGKQIHLYANYRPYFNVNVKPRYMKIKNKDYADIDKDGNYGEYDGDVEVDKKHDIDVALLYRTAVTDYSDPTVAQTATYNAINEEDLISGDKLIKTFTGISTDTLKWNVPGFDKDGKRLSYVAMVLPKGKTEADYKAFDETKWKDFGITVNVRKIINWDQVADANVPKNLHRDAGDVYGGKLAKTQVFTEKPDTFTSATSRKSEIRKGSTNEVNGYTIVMTNTPESLAKPLIKTLFNTDTEIKLDTSNVDVNDVKTINLRVPTTGTNFTTYTFTKNDQGKFICNEDSSKTVTVDAATKEITISSFNLKDLANKFVYATYANDAVTSEEGNEMIQKRLASNEVTEFEQVENKNGKPVVEMTIPGGSGNPSNPSKGTKYVVERKDPNTGTWTPVSGEKELGDEDRPGNPIKIDITGTVGHDDEIRIVAKEPDKTPTASKKSIKLDLRAPKVSGQAEDDAFRMFIDINAILDEYSKEGTVMVEVGTKGGPRTEGNIVIDNINPNKKSDKEYLVDILSKIPRESIKGIWVTAEDKFGNKTENEKLTYKPTKQIEVQYTDFRAGKSKFYMFLEGTTYNSATVTLKVTRSGHETTLDTFTINNTMTRYQLKKGGQAFKLEKGDILSIYAETSDGAHTNPHKITIE